MWQALYCHRKLAFAFYTLLELETLCCCATTEILALSIVYHIVGIFDLHTHHTLRCPQIHNPGTGRAGLTKTDLLWLPRGEQAEAGSDADTELTSYSCSLQFHEVRYYTRTNVWHAIDNSNLATRQTAHLQ